MLIAMRILRTLHDFLREPPHVHYCGYSFRFYGIIHVNLDTQVLLRDGAWDTITQWCTSVYIQPRGASHGITLLPMSFHTGIKMASRRPYCTPSKSVSSRRPAIQCHPSRLPMINHIQRGSMIPTRYSVSYPNGREVTQFG